MSNGFPSVDSLDFSKENGLLPVIIQHIDTDQVLMLGFMNQAAYAQTCETEKVTFFSRSKNRLWVKGETSGNFLFVRSISVDCDNDSLLILAEPKGPTCHTGDKSCFKTEPSMIWRLQEIIRDRSVHPEKDSYTSSLLQSGKSRIAQKVGEEGVEVALATVSGSDEEFISEAADLLFHLLVALRSREIELGEVLDVLKDRNRKENVS